MDEYTFYQTINVVDGKVEMIVSSVEILEPTPVIDITDFYNRIALDENGKIIIKIKQ